MLAGFILGVVVTIGAIAGGLYWAYKRSAPGITLPW
jgi:hypothetical protein